MQHFTLFLVSGLCALTLGCKRPDFIRLQPTIEEPPALTSVIRINDPGGSGQLLRGFYGLEGNSWRWTAPQFSVVLGVPLSAPRTGAVVVLDFSLPEAVITALKNITIRASAGAAELAPETFATSGEHEYRREVPPSAFTKDTITVDFSLNKSLKLPGDGRDLGLVATMVKMEPK